MGRDRTGTETNDDRGNDNHACNCSSTQVANGKEVSQQATLSIRETSLFLVAYRGSPGVR